VFTHFFFFFSLCWAKPCFCRFFASFPMPLVHLFFLSPPNVPSPYFYSPTFFTFSKSLCSSPPPFFSLQSTLSVPIFLLLLFLARIPDFFLLSNFPCLTLFFFSRFAPLLFPYTEKSTLLCIYYYTLNHFFLPSPIGSFSGARSLLLSVPQIFFIPSVLFDPPFFAPACVATPYVIYHICSPFVFLRRKARVCNSRSFPFPFSFPSLSPGICPFPCFLMHNVPL